MGKMKEPSDCKNHSALHKTALVIFVLFLPVVLILSAFFLPAVYDETYLSALSIKVNALRSKGNDGDDKTRKHKIVIVGGAVLPLDR